MSSPAQGPPVMVAPQYAAAPSSSSGKTSRFIEQWLLSQSLSHFSAMNGPKYSYPYPAQGYYQGPPVMAPPQYAAPPPRRELGFLEGCLAALTRAAGNVMWCLGDGAGLDNQPKIHHAQVLSQ
ncbi:hypothetical protein ZIOFF_019164 [Zingiber officinale]|uniref:Uncharacterized protein n=1 Tax=Zingiber officinale TaxID=94328 RepID=A0A8J5LSP3_ZINOF|nr:hypothetical protein ZIOFF_019164 [Zingiber officinale]